MPPNFVFFLFTLVIRPAGAVQASTSRKCRQRADQTQEVEVCHGLKVQGSIPCFLHINRLKDYYFVPKTTKINVQISKIQSVKYFPYSIYDNVPSFNEVMDAMMINFMRVKLKGSDKGGCNLM